MKTKTNVKAGSLERAGKLPNLYLYPNPNTPGTYWGG
jgi:hypothetical protein